MDDNRSEYQRIQRLVQREAEIIAQRVFKDNIEKIEFSNFKTPKHIHNGVDSPRINQMNVIPGFRALGNLTMATNNQTYKFGLNFNPSSIDFTGLVLRRDTTFTVTAANATAGAVYSNNGKNFVVITTIAGGTTLVTNGSGAAASGTLSKVSGTGDNSITFSAASSAIAARGHTVGNAQLGTTYIFEDNGTGTSVVVGQDLQAIIQGCSTLIIDSQPSTPVVRAVTSEENLIYAVYPTTSDVVALASVTDFRQGAASISVQLATGWEIQGTFIVT